MNHDGILIFLSDIPGYDGQSGSTYRSYEASKGHLIFRTCHAGVPGNPVMLPGARYNKL
jgi:hypothetical protein